jgi:biotin transport system substrate-specific component
MTVIVFQNVLCIFFASILGGVTGILPTLLWLCAGLIGFPVFAGGQSGFVALFAQWGGFYLGYLLGAIIVVLIVKKPRVDESKSLKKNIRLILAFIAGMIVMYIPGVAWYGFYASKNSFINSSCQALVNSVVVAMVPCLIADFVKMILFIPIAIKFRPIVAQYLYEQIEKE